MKRRRWGKPSSYLETAEGSAQPPKPKDLKERKCLKCGRMFETTANKRLCCVKGRLEWESWSGLDAP